MCLIILAIGQHPQLPFILAANRDEFYDRPATAAHFWDNNANLLAGRDQRGQGTWLGVHRQGRFAALTNVRAAQAPSPSAPSRGTLITEFLTSGLSPERYLHTLMPRLHHYSGFNLLLGDSTGVWFANNQGDRVQHLPAGVYGLSNARLDTPWPKVQRSKDGLKRLLSRPERPLTRDYLQLLRDDDGLPRKDRDRALAAIFVRWQDYGTRCSSVIQQDHLGNLLFTEQLFNHQAQSCGLVNYRFSTAVIGTPVKCAT